MSDKLNEVLNQRAGTHGSFKVNAEISQNLKSIFRTSPNWPTLRPYQREALDHTAGKIARALSGNANEPDHWLDMAGYASLAEKHTKEDNENLVPKKVFLKEDGM